MNFQHLTLARRLGLSFAALVLMSLFSSSLGLYKLAQVQDALDDVVLDNNRKVELLTTMSEQVHVVARVLRTLVIITEPSEDAAEHKKIDEARARYDAAWAELEKMPASPEGQDLRKSIAAAREVARPLNDQAIKAGAILANWEWRHEPEKHPNRCSRPPPNPPRWRPPDRDHHRCPNR